MCVKARLTLLSVCIALSGFARVVPQMEVLKPGAVKPTGWLLDRAVAAKNGFTGHMEDVDEHFRLAWTTNCMRSSKRLTWEDEHLGSWSAEGGAYWFDGLVKLAHQLDDPGLMALAQRRLDPLLENVGTNTIAFLWWYDRNNVDHVQDAFENGKWRFWTVGASERVLAAWWQARNDRRVPRVLANTFGYEEMARRMGSQFVSPSLAGAWVDAFRISQSPQVYKGLDICCEGLRKVQYAKVPDPELVNSLDLKRDRLVKMGPYGWQNGAQSRHGVEANEYLLSVLRAYLHTGDKEFLDAVLAWYDFFGRNCRQPYGLSAMDEEWGWAGAKRGTETCVVAAETFTKENLLAALGDGKWGDDVECAFFNAGPACVTRDFKRHVYFQLPNRIGKSGDGASMSWPVESHVRYGLSVWPLCCTAALNRILPNFVQFMWMRTANDGVAVALYGPSTVSLDLPCGKVEFAEKTAYPFGEVVEIHVRRAPGTLFELKFRLPGWCDKPEIAINEATVTPAVEKGFASVSRTWKAGDRIRLRFPMVPRFVDFHDMNEQGCLRRSVMLGPLLFVAGIPEKDENTPAVEFVEPCLSAQTTASDFVVDRSEMPACWDWPFESPLRITGLDSAGKELKLIPYGCTKMRISAFKVR